MIEPMSISLPSFLAGWYGPPDVRPGTLPAGCSWLPEPLQEWYRLSSQWSKPLMELKRMCAPEDVTADGGQATFLTDPTGEWLWAFDTADPDVVYDRELYGQQTAERLPEFLIHNALNKAVTNTDSWRLCTDLPEHHLVEVLAPMTKVGFCGWRWPQPGVRVFMNETILAEVKPALGPTVGSSRPGYAQVHVAANRPEAIGYLDNLHGIGWLGSP